MRHITGIFATAGILLAFGCTTTARLPMEKMETFAPAAVEGEDFAEMKGIKVEAHVGYFDAGDWIRYRDVDFGKGASELAVRIAGKNSGGLVELRTGGLDGTLLGTYTMKATGGWYEFEDRNIRIKKISGVHDLYFVGKKGDGIFNLDRFQPKEVEGDDPLYADASRGEWTLVVIPDTQHYSQNRGNAPLWHMQRAFEWIVNVRDQLNIQMVQGLGDITESWDNSWEWDNSFSAWDKLEGHVAYMPIMGNHDSPWMINRYFPVSRFSGHYFWGGDFGGIENNYFLMRLGEEDYLFLHVEPYDQYSEYWPAGIEWAKKILGEHPSRKVILATHDTWDTNHIRNQLLEKYDNIVLSNAGHTCVREAMYETWGPGGGHSYNFITDYQCDDQEVMKLRYYVFKPLEDKVDYYTYSPVTGEFEADSNSQGSFRLVQKD